MAYPELRERIYGPLREGFWDCLYGKEYALAAAYPVTEAWVTAVREAAVRIARIFAKTAALLRRAPDEVLAQLGLPPQTFRVVRRKPLSADAVICRLDLAVTDSGIKLLELNADTPTFIKELFFVNGRVAHAFGLEDPNKGLEEHLQRAVRTAVAESCAVLGVEPDEAHVVFTAHADHPEDYHTTLYLKEVSGLVNASFTPLDELAIDGSGLYDHAGRKIDVLYRQTYPLEHLAADVDPDTGAPIGALLLEHVRRKKVALLNPPSAFLLQSKAVQVVVWGLHEAKSPYFTDEEHEWIAQHVLPTYLEPDVLRARGVWYVQKPAFGREGDTVVIFDERGVPIDASPKQSYRASVPVYQQYVPLPRAVVPTASGPEEVSLLVCCFLLYGEASAVGLRAGPPITDDLSYFLPIGILSKGGDER